MALQSDGNVVTWGQYNGEPPQGLNQVTGIGSGGSHYLAIRSGVLTPLISLEPGNTFTTNGGSVTFTASGFAFANVTYQWQFDGVNIAGATSSSLTLTGVGSSQVGTYDVVVSNPAGSITSSNATFGIPVPPVITSLTWPQRQYIYAQSNALLSITVPAPGFGAPALGYQWSYNGTQISGATSSSYSAPSGNATYSVTVTNNAGNNGGAGTNASWQTFALAPGLVAGWGKDDFTQSDIPSTLTNVIGIAAGESNSVAVQENGQVIQWGYNWTNVPSNLTNAVAVAAGYSHNLALNSNGTVTAWGATGDPANTVPSGLNGVKAIAAGWFHNLALGTNGMVTCWGTNNFTITNVPSSLSNVVAIAAGSLHSLALESNGTVVAWGYNSSGQTNVPTSLTNVVAIAAGKLHSLALQSNGIVIAWGDNTYGQTNVPNGITAMATAAGDGFSMALLNNGAVTNWGDDTYGEITNQPGALVNVKLIAAGGFHASAAIFNNLLLYYPLNVSKDLLLVYNTESTDSSNICQYYLQHRPMVGNANVLGIAVPPTFVSSNNGGANFIAVGNTNIFETILPSVFTNDVLTPMTNWLATNQTLRPQFVVMFHDVPTRIDTNTTYPFSSGTASSNVTYKIMNEIPGWQPLVTYIDMGDTNACIAYINKIAAMATNDPPGSLIISGSAATNSYANTNYYFDDSGNIGATPGAAATNVLMNDGVPPSAITYIYVDESFPFNYSNGSNTNYHITSGTTVCGYTCFGFHSSLGAGYATNDEVTFHGNSGWYLIRTEESDNGQRFNSDGGTFPQWFSPNAFGGGIYAGGTNYNYINTPVGACATVSEPNNAEPFANCFGSWQNGQLFIFCPWTDSINVYVFLVIGDPFIRK